MSYKQPKGRAEALYKNYGALQKNLSAFYSGIAKTATAWKENQRKKDIAWQKRIDKQVGRTDKSYKKIMEQANAFAQEIGGPEGAAWANQVEYNLRIIRNQLRTELQDQNLSQDAILGLQTAALTDMNTLTTQLAALSMADEEYSAGMNLDGNEVGANLSGKNMGLANVFEDIYRDDKQNAVLYNQRLAATGGKGYKLGQATYGLMLEDIDNRDDKPLENINLGELAKEERQFFNHNEELDSKLLDPFVEDIVELGNDPAFKTEDGQIDIAKIKDYVRTDSDQKNKFDDMLKDINRNGYWRVLSDENLDDWGDYDNQLNDDPGLLSDKLIDNAFRGNENVFQETIVEEDPQQQQNIQEEEDIQQNTQPQIEEEVEVITDYDFGGLKKTKDDFGGNLVAKMMNDDDDYIRKIANFESTSGSSSGTGLANFGMKQSHLDKYRKTEDNPNGVLPENTKLPTTIEEFVDIMKKTSVEDVANQIGMSLPPELSAALVDYSYNSGRDSAGVLLIAAGIVDGKENHLMSSAEGKKLYDKNKEKIREMINSGKIAVKEIANAKDQSYKGRVENLEGLISVRNPVYPSWWKSSGGVTREEGKPISKDDLKIIKFAQEGYNKSQKYRSQMFVKQEKESAKSDPLKLNK